MLRTPSLFEVTLLSTDMASMTEDGSPPLLSVACGTGVSGGGGGSDGGGNAGDWGSVTTEDQLLHKMMFSALSNACELACEGRIFSEVVAGATTGQLHVPPSASSIQEFQLANGVRCAARILPNVAAVASSAAVSAKPGPLLVVRASAALLCYLPLSTLVAAVVALIDRCTAAPPSDVRDPPHRVPSSPSRRARQAVERHAPFFWRQAHPGIDDLGGASPAATALSVTELLQHPDLLAHLRGEIAHLGRIVTLFSDQFQHAGRGGPWSLLEASNFAGWWWSTVVHPIAALTQPADLVDDFDPAQFEMSLRRLLRLRADMEPYPTLLSGCVRTDPGASAPPARFVVREVHAFSGGRRLCGTVESQYHIAACVVLAAAEATSADDFFASEGAALGRNTSAAVLGGGDSSGASGPGGGGGGALGSSEFTQRGKRSFGLYAFVSAANALLARTPSIADRRAATTPLPPNGMYHSDRGVPFQGDQAVILVALWGLEVVVLVMSRARCDLLGTTLDGAASSMVDMMALVRNPFGPLPSGSLVGELTARGRFSPWPSTLGAALECASTDERRRLMARDSIAKELRDKNLLLGFEVYRVMRPQVPEVARLHNGTEDGVLDCCARSWLRGTDEAGAPSSLVSGGDGSHIRCLTAANWLDKYRSVALSSSGAVLPNQYLAKNVALEEVVAQLSEGGDPTASANGTAVQVERKRIALGCECFDISSAASSIGDNEVVPLRDGVAKSVVLVTVYMNNSSSFEDVRRALAFLASEFAMR